MITYNQERYISQAIDSVLMQEVNFDYEIVIGEDCSTDSTQNILLAYRDKFPDKIKLLLNDSNKGVTLNFAQTLKACSGDYIALLEGDDYWTSASKLQKQVDFLDSNLEYVTCYHAAQLVDAQEVPRLVIPLERHKKKTSTLIDLIRDDSFMATCSIIFRARAFEYFPDIFFVWKSGCDWPLNVLNAEKGPIGYIDEIMSVYRSGSGESSWTSKPLSIIMEDAIKFNEQFNVYFEYRFDKIIKMKIERYLYTIAVDYLRQGQILNSLDALNKSLKIKFSFKKLFKFLFKDGPYDFSRGFLARRFPLFLDTIKKITRK
jgi:glycosyltransferase involved in cell wall biosynthesis